MILECVNPFFLFAVITGQHRSGVISARTRIDVLLLTFRRKQPFTHFLAFFLNEVEVQDRFLKFQEEVLERCSMVSSKTSKVKSFKIKLFKPLYRNMCFGFSTLFELDTNKKTVFRLLLFKITFVMKYAET